MVLLPIRIQTSDGWVSQVSGRGHTLLEPIEGLHEFVEAAAVPVPGAALTEGQIDQLLVPESSPVESAVESLPEPLGLAPSPGPVTVPGSALAPDRAATEAAAAEAEAEEAAKDAAVLIAIAWHCQMHWTSTLAGLMFPWHREGRNPVH